MYNNQRGINTIRGLELKVLSKTHSAPDIMREVQNFWEIQRTRLFEQFNESELKLVKTAVVKNLMDPPNNLFEEASEVWGYLLNEMPFDWTNKVITAVELMDIETIQNAATQWIFKPQSRRSLSILINGSMQPEPALCEVEFLGAPIKVYRGIDGVKELRNEIVYPDEKNLD